MPALQRSGYQHIVIRLFGHTCGKICLNSTNKLSDPFLATQSFELEVEAVTALAKADASNFAFGCLQLEYLSLEVIDWPCCIQLLQWVQYIL